MLASLLDDALGRRDRALFLVLQSGLLRRAEAAALTWRDVRDAGDGTGRLTVRRSKTDQEGCGAVMPLTPEALALDALRADASNLEGAIFRSASGPRARSRMSGHAVAEVLRRRCRAAGLAGRYSGHSLRRGTAETLAAATRRPAPPHRTAGDARSARIW